MITPEFALTMARYNRWQNDSIYTAASTLSDADRRKDRGAFFGSIHATLNHVLWGDQIWMARFSDTPEPVSPGIPGSVEQYPDWNDLVVARQSFDNTVLDWASTLDAAWLSQELSWYSGAMRQDVSRPAALLVVHMFNHQTHHRGQVHAMLTASGARPGDTDLPFQGI